MLSLLFGGFLGITDIASICQPTTHGWNSIPECVDMPFGILSLSSDMAPLSNNPQINCTSSIGSPNWIQNAPTASICTYVILCIRVYLGGERERDRKTERQKDRQKERKRTEKKRKERKRTEKERKEERETQEFKTLAFTGFNPLFVETTLSSISMAKVLGLWIVEAGSSWVYHIPHPLKERVRTLNTINIAK